MKVLAIAAMQPLRRRIGQWGDRAMKGFDLLARTLRGRDKQMPQSVCGEQPVCGGQPADRGVPFDDFARLVASALPRRQVLRLALVSLAGVAMETLGVKPSGASVVGGSGCCCAGTLLKANEACCTLVSPPEPYDTITQSCTAGGVLPKCGRSVDAARPGYTVCSSSMPTGGRTCDTSDVPGGILDVNSSPLQKWVDACKNKVQVVLPDTDHICSIPPPVDFVVDWQGCCLPPFALVAAAGGTHNPAGKALEAYLRLQADGKQKVDFRPSCITHDCCYTTCNNDWQACNDTLYDNLYAACKSKLKGLELQECYARADAIRLGVDSPIGLYAYQNDQATHCDCAPGAQTCADSVDACNGVCCGPDQTCVGGQCQGSGGTCSAPFVCGDCPFNLCKGACLSVVDTCACFPSVEGQTRCGNDYTCGSTPNCSTSAECGPGFYCGISCCGQTCIPECGLQVAQPQGFSPSRGTATGG
jgi:hypothetical protein